MLNSRKSGHVAFLQANKLAKAEAALQKGAESDS